MASNLFGVAKRLLRAINSSGLRPYKITMSTKQFIGDEGKPINLYVLSNAVPKEGTTKYFNQEIYSTASMLRIVLYLRDEWYRMNGKELPTDQEKWNQIRAGLEEKDG